MASVKEHTADEVLELMNRIPLFMTTLDETDGSGGTNIELEALKALAYEGTRAEVADNFRVQGNEMVAAKRWVDARVFYDKALAALKMDPKDLGEDPDMPVLKDGEGEDGVVDEMREREKEKAVEEKCLGNRAFCNLEMSNCFPSSFPSLPLPASAPRGSVVATLFRG